jgi:hypothetical protein
MAIKGLLIGIPDRKLLDDPQYVELQHRYYADRIEVWIKQDGKWMPWSSESNLCWHGQLPIYRGQ